MLCAKFSLWIAMNELQDRAKTILSREMIMMIVLTTGRIQQAAVAAGL